MRAIAYMRCSTAEQTDGYGLAAQQQRICDAISHKGWELVSVLSDEGVSGKTLERPKLMQALEMIAQHEADALVVAKLDRLTRSVIDFAMLLEWFDRADAALVALDFDLDTSTPGGRLVAHIMSAVAEWERSTIAQRTKDGLAERRRQGKVIGRTAVMDHPEVVQMIRELHAEGKSLQKIADGLNELRVPTVRGGLMWRPSAVQSIVGYKRRPSRRSLVLPEVRSQRAR